MSSSVNGGRSAERPDGSPMRGQVTDDEHHPVAHALEAARDDHRYGVPDVHVRRGRVDAELDHERPALAQQVGEVGRLDGAARCSPGDQVGLLGRRKIAEISASPACEFVGRMSCMRCLPRCGRRTGGAALGEASAGATRRWLLPEPVDTSYAAAWQSP